MPHSHAPACLHCATPVMFPPSPALSHTPSSDMLPEEYSTLLTARRVTPGDALRKVRGWHSTFTILRNVACLPGLRQWPTTDILPKHSHASPARCSLYLYM